MQIFVNKLYVNELTQKKGSSEMNNTAIQQKLETRRKLLNRQDLIKIGVITLICTLAGVILGMYQISEMTAEMKKTIIDQLGSLNTLYINSVITTAVPTLIAVPIGLMCSRKTGLKLHVPFTKKDMSITILIASLTSLFMGISERFIFSNFMIEPTTSYEFSFGYFMSSITYGGIVEEVWMRLFMMSLFVLIGAKLIRINREDIPSSKGIHYVAISLTAILFALGHLPTTVQTLGSSFPIIMRMFILNGAAGIGYGYLYWKYGLTSAILAHMMTHVFNQLLLMPILF